MELLAGARDERHRHNLRRLIARAALVPTQPGDFDQVATTYGLCRSRGETVRVLIVCLIDALAIRADLPVLHNDGDFDTLARHTPLRVERVPFTVDQSFDPRWLGMRSEPDDLGCLLDHFSPSTTTTVAVCLGDGRIHLLTDFGLGRGLPTQFGDSPTADGKSLSFRRTGVSWW